MALSGFRLTRPEERCSRLGEIRAWAQATAAAEDTEHDVQTALVTRERHLHLILDSPHHFFFKLYVSILLLKVLNLNIVKTRRTKSVLSDRHLT